MAVRVSVPWPPAVAIVEVSDGAFDGADVTVEANQHVLCSITNNDSDPDGDTMTATLVAYVGPGDLTLEDPAWSLPSLVMVLAAGEIDLDAAPEEGQAGELAAAMDAIAISRSRTNGFDYAPTSNSLVFIGVPYPKGSQIVASYRRFKDQVPVIK